MSQSTRSDKVDEPSVGANMDDIHPIIATVVPSWPPEDAMTESLEATAQAVAAEVAALAATNPDAPAVRRAIAASRRATASVAPGIAAHGPSRVDGDATERWRDVAEAVLTLQGVDWESRVGKAMARIDEQAAEFEAQLKYLREHGALPVAVQRVAVEQLLDAIGAIVMVLQGILVQAEQELARDGFFMEGFGVIDSLQVELRHLCAAVRTVQQWRLDVPPELLSFDSAELSTLPLASTDPILAGHDGTTVQRVVGALVVDGGVAALKHVAWVDFDDDGEPVFRKKRKGVTIRRPPRPRISLTTKSRATKQLCAKLDAAIDICRQRATAATSSLVPAVLGDVAAYGRARAAALDMPGAQGALAELTKLYQQVPQPCGSRDSDIVHASSRSGTALPSTGMARAKALARLADPDAPPPTALEHAVHKQLRAAAGSKRLYALVSEVARQASPELVVLPGGVKKLPRTVFKCAVNYDCDLSQINDQVRCTVVADSLVGVAATMRALLASPHVSVVRVKNRFAADYNAVPAGGYVDLQTIVLFECGAGVWMLGEVQVNLWSMLRIKESPNGGHKVFNFARSLRAYDEETYTYNGQLDAEVVARIAAGQVLDVTLRSVEAKAMKDDRAELWRALASDKCRVMKLGLIGIHIGDSGTIALADALKTNTFITVIDLGHNNIGDAGVVAFADALKTNTSITKIGLSSNTIGDSAAVALANTLKTNTSITEVNLGGNKIGDPGAVALADALKTNTSITWISVRDNVIGDTGGMAVADALKSNTSVTEINLYENKIGPSGRAALVDARKINTKVKILFS